ncbi:uncharacterized protein LOC125072814 [Vanessa atalanta]|uniref:uncharacterized protein LOC125072814 n=1 Tax=Vanessa atalanta TaxID=42275 RepID=UPI001FCCCBCC|nr:uncharacterized protein LOC125072814 [Vanessa atalanta]
MSHKVLAILAMLAVSSAEKEQTRWSRQISSYTSDISDWVPLRVPTERDLPQIKRQAVAEPRILSEPFAGFVRPTGFSQDTFPSRTFYNSPTNRQLYLQSVPSAPQNYLSDQGFSQGLRFGLTQPNFPLSQGFITPQFNFDKVPQIKSRPQTGSNPIKFESSFKTSQPSQSLSPNPPVLKPFNQPLKHKHEIPKFVDGYRAENSSESNFANKQTQSSQKVNFDNTNLSKESFGSPKMKVEREEVQLLYVPLESLNRGQFNFRSPLTSAQLVNTELYNQNHRSNPLKQNLAGEFHGPVMKPLETYHSQEFLTNFNSQLHEVSPFSKFSTITTPFSTTASTTAKPKKLKPHQPPLAIFLTQDAKKEDQVKVGDVLYSLKNANTVPVLDSVNPLNAPKVFIGPSSLSPPDTYVKFELPYLSNIENSDKKLRQLPFFVAPLSYNTPQGFAKIPFPSPHVGSVVINSLIKDTTSTNKAVTGTNIYTHSYSEPTFKQDQKVVTQKAKVSYYTTSSPKTNSALYEQSYYSIEPQSVSTLGPFKEPEPSIGSQSTPLKSGSYFLSNMQNQYNPTQFINFPQDTRFKTPEPTKNLNIYKFDTTPTPRTTVTSTTKLPTTHSSQLLETHNPYSINQAFHFSTPLDYHNFFDEYKEPYATPGTNQSPSPSTIPITPAPLQTTIPEEREQPQQLSYQPTQQSLPDYLQNQTLEFHRDEEKQNLKYPAFNTNEYSTKIESFPQNQYSNSAVNVNENTQTIRDESEQNTKKVESSQQEYVNYTNVAISQSDSLSNYDQSTNTSPKYNIYDENYNSYDLQSSTTSSTSTTTRRSPIRTRGRPRYPTTKSESSESSTRATITRRPLRERKPLPTRSRYEPNKITSEKPIRNQFESNESTTKSSRTRTRGRVHYKPSDTDDIYTKRNKQSSKEHDLAYQRDVLHQNYPVTLMERTSTADIEAITEPSEKFISTNNLNIIKTEDTEDAYSNDKISITEPINRDLKDLSQQYTTAVDTVTDAPYEQKVHAGEDHIYQLKGSKTHEGAELSYDEVKEGSYSVQTSPEYKIDNQDNIPTNPANPITEQNTPISSFDEIQSKDKEEITTSAEAEENTKIANQEISHEQEQEENVVETTPSYNRVRVRPGVIRQYHQSSSSDSSRLRNERRKTVQAITYRPAFDKRRTTMKIEEIEADLKTKQIHIRPEFQDYKQPVYKPEPSTESVLTSTTQETSTKRGQFRRRRPNYGMTSTEGTVPRRTYEIKNRFRGRRPTEKPTENPDIESDVTTVKSNVHSRYSHRPRLSERYNQKPETDDQASEDQDSNYSINRPKYVAPESDRWSPKISKDSFKPFNPNNIADDIKVEQSTSKSKNEELDIITARNEYEDILISVTPATNNRVQKKISDIPPTLEAFVEQSKVTKVDSDSMSTFESMLEEVMKNLEEQDENEYTGNVMKHKGGEIGEIPPERIISSGENYSLKSTTPLQEETTTTAPDNSSVNVTEEVPSRNNRRRGFWKRVKKVRPVNEEIEVAESQYYSSAVNQLGQPISKNLLENTRKDNVKATTYKPNYQFLKDFFDIEDDQIDAIPNIDIPKITNSHIETEAEVLKDNLQSSIQTDVNGDRPAEIMSPGDMDLGTGSPNPTLDDSAFYSDPTEPSSIATASIDRSDGFSFMDYLFGETASDKIESVQNNTTKSIKETETTTTPQAKYASTETEITKVKATTESTYIPEEITAEIINDGNEEGIVTESVTSIETRTTNSYFNSEEKEVKENPAVKVETSSISSFMDPTSVVSTSMSTEISHETEICFRGKCIKSNKNLL